MNQYNSTSNYLKPQIHLTNQLRCIKSINEKVVIMLLLVLHLILVLMLMLIIILILILNLILNLIPV